MRCPMCHEDAVEELETIPPQYLCKACHYRPSDVVMAALSRPQTHRVDIYSHVDHLAGYLRAGREIWGGGAGVRPFKIRGNGYLVTCPNEDGSEFTREFDVGDEEAAIWCLLQCVNGCAVFTIEVPK